MLPGPRSSSTRLNWLTDMVDGIGTTVYTYPSGGLALAYAKRQYGDCFADALGNDAAEKACYKKWNEKINDLQRVYDKNCKCKKELTAQGFYHLRERRFIG